MTDKNKVRGAKVTKIIHDEAVEPTVSAERGKDIKFLHEDPRFRHDHELHQYPLGSVIQVKIDSCVFKDDKRELCLAGVADVFVVAHNRDVDGTPLYTVSTFPCEWKDDYNMSSKAWYHYFVCSAGGFFGHGFSEDSITQPHRGEVILLHEHVQDYISKIRSSIRK